MRCGPSKKRTAILAAVLSAASGGCSGLQSALDPAGPEAEAVARLTWIMIAGGTAILALVMLIAWYAIARDPDKRWRLSSTALIVAGGVALPIVVLSALLVYGVWLTGELRASDDEGALRIHVTGHMWWWEVHYPGAREGERVASANEIRIPAGRRVAFSFSSEDVIHSFWVPNLAGKIDLVPGRVTRMSLQADRPGLYRGQCAEFCGAQHARMAFHVIALEPEAFERWLARLLEQANGPTNENSARGREAFLAEGCGECHTVRGVADSRIAAPDLTHVGTRGWIGAGTLENNREHMITWLARGDSVKPGRAMPSFSHLDRATLAALADYLADLE
jgi:cytochrome c oxidase subunit II